MAQVTIITLGVTLVMLVGGMFPRTLWANPHLFVLYLWMQGLQSFGFIIMVSTLLPSKMYPKIAAKWGTLIYFCQTFADFMTKKPYCPEAYKVAMGLIFPNTATAKAGITVVALDYKPGGVGLTLETMWQRHSNFTVG